MLTEVPSKDLRLEFEILENRKKEKPFKVRNFSGSLNLRDANAAF